MTDNICGGFADGHHPLGPGFAAELRGVTLADVAADDAVYAAVRAAFKDYSVLLFRGQEVSGEGELACSSRFGPPETTKVGSLGTGSDFVILTTISNNGKVVPEDHRYAMRNKADQLSAYRQFVQGGPSAWPRCSRRVLPFPITAAKPSSSRPPARLRAARSRAAGGIRKLIRLASLRPLARQGRSRPRHAGGAGCTVRRAAGA